MVNPVPLYKYDKSLRGFRKARAKSSSDFISACGECGSVFKEQQLAIDCCKSYTCSICKKPTKNTWVHPYCRDQRDLGQAELVTDYAGPVYDLNTEQFFEDMELLLDYYADGERTVPEYAFCVTTEPWKGVSVNWEDELQELYEDANQDVIDPEGLERAIEEWNKKQGIMVWHVDLERKVAIPKKEAGSEQGETL